MVIKYSRAQRRHDYFRLKEKRKTYWGFGKDYGWRSEDMDSRRVGMVIRTPKPCSCEMCRNPRHCNWSKKEQLTMQERKALEAWLYEIEEIINDC